MLPASRCPLPAKQLRTTFPPRGVWLQLQHCCQVACHSCHCLRLCLWRLRLRRLAGCLDSWLTLDLAGTGDCGHLATVLRMSRTGRALHTQHTHTHTQVRVVHIAIACGVNNVAALKIAVPHTGPGPNQQQQQQQQHPI